MFLGVKIAMHRSNNSSSKVTLKIPRPLYEKIALVIEDSGYNSVTDFVVYVLRDLVASHRSPGKAEMSHDDIELVKRRLVGLGYLDSSSIDSARQQESDKGNKNG